jgi:hypothetical protein
MRRRKRREPDVLSDGVGDDQAVVGQRHDGIRRSARREVVAPELAREAHGTIAVLIPGSQEMVFGGSNTWTRLATW